MSQNLGKPVGFGVRDWVSCLSVSAFRYVFRSIAYKTFKNVFLGHLEKQNGNKTRGIEKASNYPDLYFW